MRNPIIRKIRDQIVYKSSFHGCNYNSFPTAVVTKSGKIIVSFRQARDMRTQFGKTEHVDPASRAVQVCSHDNGQTWSDIPEVIHDDFLSGFMEAYLNVLSDGTLFAASFCWGARPRDSASVIDDHDILLYNGAFVGSFGGLFTFRTSDEGKSWDNPVLVKTDETDKLASRGQIAELPDGSLLLSAYSYKINTGKSEVYILKSQDRGKSWVTTASLEHPYRLNETGLFLTSSGKIMAFIRCDYKNQDPRVGFPLFTSESMDEGKTWAPVIQRPIHSENPFHALRLSSGRTLLTYGYRFAPFGVRALLLDAECEEWEGNQPMILREDGLGIDLGYTSAVQLANGEIWIFYYFYDEDGFRYIAASICREG